MTKPPLRPTHLHVDRLMMQIPIQFIVQLINLTYLPGQGIEPPNNSLFAAMRSEKERIKDMNKTNKRKGAVSLFVVIFAALLITVVTVSFIRIMIQNQQQATANDLSQSAYDSAQAGVEDAKRAILLYMKDCSGGNCDLTKIDSPTCNVAVRTLSDVSQTGNEIPIQTTSSDSKLNQAYTCVKINMTPQDYLWFLETDVSKMVPLVGVGDFNTIKIEWFNSNDSSGGSVGGSSTTSIDVPALGSTPLLSQDNWLGIGTTNNSRPSILRAQLIQFNTVGFKLDDFGFSSNDKASNNTLFLYPSAISAAAGTSSFLVDVRPNKTGAPSPENCRNSIAAGGYACSATLTLSKTVDSSHIAYLNLKSFYRASHFRITLYDSTQLVSGEPGKLVLFDKVQPSIDSTGRANDMFRRVQSRVELTNTDFPYPRAEIDVTGNLCKDFTVTDKAFNEDGTTDYSNRCNP